MLYFLNWYYGIHNLTDLCVSRNAFEQVISDLSTEFEIHIAENDNMKVYSIINYYGEKDIIGKILKGGSGYSPMGGVKNDS